MILIAVAVIVLIFLVIYLYYKYQRKNKKGGAIQDLKSVNEIIADDYKNFYI